MTKKQEVRAVTEFLLGKLRESAETFKDEDNDETKEKHLARVIVARDFLNELNNKQNGKEEKS